MNAASRPEVPPDVQAFRQGMRQFINCPTIVSAAGPNGEMAGMTATSVCSLSADPPSLLTCLHRKSALAELLQVGDGFAINLPSAEQEAIARVFGGMGEAQGADKFSHGIWSRGITGAPVLEQARVTFECRVADVFVGFSHLIVVGIVQETRLGNTDRRGLAYANGRFLDWAETGI